MGNIKPVVVDGVGETIKKIEFNGKVYSVKDGKAFKTEAQDISSAGVTSTEAALMLEQIDELREKLEAAHNQLFEEMAVQVEKRDKANQEIAKLKATLAAVCKCRDSHEETITEMVENERKLKAEVRRLEPDPERPSYNELEKMHSSLWTRHNALVRKLKSELDKADNETGLMWHCWREWIKELLKKSEVE